MSSKMPDAIAPLTKVTLSIHATADNRQTAKEVTPAEFEFIFGLGTQGLTEFEMGLIGKNRGDRITTSVEAHQAASYFEHLLTPFLETVPALPPFDLHLEVLSVSAATNSELVRALSQKVENSGCGGDCGCGCG